MKIRFIEPGNLPYRKSIKNRFVYNKYIRTPSNGMITLATILTKKYNDVLCYSESVSKIPKNDVMDADIIFFSIFSYNANRGYKLASYIRKHSNALIVFGGLHATLDYKETIKYCDYVLLGEGDEQILPFVEEIEAKKTVDVPGVVFHTKGRIKMTGEPVIPNEIDTIPNRNLLYNFKKMAGHSTIWPQVHASRGCPHHCDYCALVAAFGSVVRVRSVDSVIEDIRQAIDFFDNGHHRLAKILWITDDNFFANREWAMKVLRAIIDSGIKYSFTIQARFEVGFDDEMLNLLKKAGFKELAMGIEFLEDESFENYHKTSTYSQILKSVKNIQKHGMNVRGLFIVGADNHTVGVGDRLADFVIKNDIKGILIQSMYFIPGTAVYETHKDALLDKHDWSRCIGKVVHYPKNISPCDLQNEIIRASARIYSPARLIHAIIHRCGVERIVFLGEYFWQADVRKDLLNDLKYLSKYKWPQNSTEKTLSINKKTE